jgi:hypothetical protein
MAHTAHRSPCEVQAAWDAFTGTFEPWTAQDWQAGKFSEPRLSQAVWQPRIVAALRCHTMQKKLC